MEPVLEPAEPMPYPTHCDTWLGEWSHRIRMLDEVAMMKRHALWHTSGQAHLVSAGMRVTMLHCQQSLVLWVILPVRITGHGHACAPSKTCVYAQLACIDTKRKDNVARSATAVFRMDIPRKSSIPLCTAHSTMEAPWFMLTC